MRNPGRLLAILLLVASPGWMPAGELPRVQPESVGISQAKLQAIGPAVESLMRSNKLAGAVVLVARHGKIAHLQAYGRMDRDRPMREDAVFRIYSMTKPVVTAGALILHEQGRFQLDDPVSKYLPEWKGLKVHHPDGPRAPSREMTVRDLMRHTSGLTYGFFGNSPVDELYLKLNVLDQSKDLKSMIQKLSGIPLDYDPGTDWQYSLSVDVLGYLIEAWSGKALDAFLKDALLDPLDMRDTGFYASEAQLERLVPVHLGDGTKPLTMIPDTPPERFTRPPSFLMGGGGLVSTIRDFARFLQMLVNGGELDGVQLLRPETVRMMTSNQLDEQAMPVTIGEDRREGVGFGLGFSVRVARSDWDPEGHVGEYGWGGMASTHFWVSPEDDLIVVTMEQTLPYNWNLEWGLKGLIYGAIRD